MIIKGRSPTMRRVSRPHRVALDRLFDRINLDPIFLNQIKERGPTMRHVFQNPQSCFGLVVLTALTWDPKIQIKYVDTKNQLADNYEQRKFHAWWNGAIFFVCFHIMIFFSVVLHPFESFSFWSSLDPPRNQKAMSKRGQEGASSDGSMMAKPKLASPIKAKARPMNLVSHSSNVQLSARSSSAQDLSNPENHGKRRRTRLVFTLAAEKQQRSCRAFTSMETGRCSKHSSLGTGQSGHVLRPY